MTITSLQNPRIKQLVLLQQKSSERRKQGLFVVEGRRELQHCVDAGLHIEELFCCPELLEADVNNTGSDLFTIDASSPTPRTDVSSQVYAKIAYRGTTEGILATVSTPTKALDCLNLKDNPLVIVLESVEKPGNLGAILRSADAAGVDAVIVCDPLTDLFNPNLIRSSIGAIFTVPTAVCTSEQCIDFLKTHKIQILTAQLQDSSLYYDTPMTSGTAIVMGTESTGLSPQWRKAADAHIRIPMLGRLDSLNVSVSAAILMFEAVRQRETSLSPCPSPRGGERYDLHI